jgi:hypothetical protein
VNETTEKSGETAESVEKKAVTGAAEQRSTEATIAGTIYKPTGEPLGGATVELVTNKVFSKSDGTYIMKIPVPESGKVTLAISCIGFVSETKEVKVSPAETQNLDFKLGKGKASIGGYVYDKDTRAKLGGAYVSIESQRIYADENGHYAFKGLDAVKRYPFTCYKDGYKTEIFLSDWVQPDQTLTQDIYLTKADEAAQKPSEEPTQGKALETRSKEELKEEWRTRVP